MNGLQLCTADDVTAQTFHMHARRVNTALSLASLIMREVHQPGGGLSPSVVIQGWLYHRIGPLRVRDGDEPAFAQIYVNDPECDDPAAWPRAAEREKWASEHRCATQEKAGFSSTRCSGEAVEREDA